MSGRTALILDDDEKALLVLRAILESKDLRIFESGDEKSAVEHCERWPGAIDVLVADVLLRYSDGPAVVRRVKYLQPQMGIVFISGFGLDELARRGLLDHHDVASEGVAFLQKPFTAEALFSRIEAMVGGAANSAE
jgi:two-component system, cell cycle sensor histidine kinase and response regulator CckA